MNNNGNPKTQAAERGDASIPALTPDEEVAAHITCLALSNWTTFLAGEVPRTKKTAARVVAKAIAEIERSAGTIPPGQRMQLQEDLTNRLLRYLLDAAAHVLADADHLLHQLPGSAEVLAQVGWQPDRKGAGRG